MRRFLDGVRKAVRAVSLVLLAALIVTPLAQILMRGVFNVPMAGAEPRGYAACPGARHLNVPSGLSAYR